MRYRRIWQVGTAIVLLGIVCAGAFAYQWKIPGSWLGVKVFQWKYEHATNRAEYLRAYHERLGRVCGWYLPADVDEWLLQKFADEPQERADIVGFYARQAGIGSRENGSFIKLGPKFAAEVMKALPTYSEKVQIRGGMILLEDTRRGRVMYKARLEGEPDSFGHAIGLYQAWWNEDVAWNIKKEKDPLAGSGLYWGEP